MLNRLFGSALHEHADPQQRILGIAALPADSPVLATLLNDDPSAEVRAAAAARCEDLTLLRHALNAQPDPQVQASIHESLGRILAGTSDEPLVRTMLGAAECSDAVRAKVAFLASDEVRRQLALESIRDENVLVDIALEAPHAPLRLAAAERVHEPAALSRLADGARDKDRGVARLARQRLDTIEHGQQQRTTADEILAQAAALVDQPGPIVSSAVELERRWSALGLADDPERQAHWLAIGAQLQQRFDREAEAQRTQQRFEQQLSEWSQALQSEPSTYALGGLRDQFNTLRAHAVETDNRTALERLQEAESQLTRWEQAAPGLAVAETLVKEAEAIAADASIDDAQLPSRWQALDATARTPALTQRFEAALQVIEQRRQTFIRATEQQHGVARQQLHNHLHQAEQALTAGQLQEARAAADSVRALRAHAGQLPKPTIQRLGRVMQQLGELERWQKFGQQSARVQLCERAEALATQTLTPAAVAREVQQLRAEWKKLDEQQDGVPKALWQRFDGACEKAYAPAARHFAEQSARYKAAAKQREDFLAIAEVHAPTLLTESPDWRAIERWIHETENNWRNPTLGSVQESAWKKLDARLKQVLAPLRERLSAVRQQAKAERQQLIDEAKALAAKSHDRETPSQVKALQARWQAHAKSMTLQQRDERVLWENFRAACDAVFESRKKSRDEADERKHSQRQVFEALCEQLEALVAAGGTDEAQFRRSQRELQDAWAKAAKESGPVPGGLEGRFRAARGKIDDALRARKREQQTAVWRALLDKEHLCEELDRAARDGGSVDAESFQSRWDALPALTAAWEQKLVARRNAAQHALTDAAARTKLIAQIESGSAARRDALLQLELMLSIDSPADLQQERRALQLKQLRDRFKRDDSGSRGAADQILVDWCARAGVADERDPARCERIATAIERRR